MSLWHLNIALSLFGLDGLNLDSDEAVNLVSQQLTEADIFHQCRIGSVKDKVNGIYTLRHRWVELEDGWCVDFKVREWLGDEDDIPHGVFRFCDYPRVKYYGTPLVAR